MIDFDREELSDLKPFTRNKSLYNKLAYEEFKSDATDNNNINMLRVTTDLILSKTQSEQLLLEKPVSNKSGAHSDGDSD